MRAARVGVRVTAGSKSVGLVGPRQTVDSSPGGRMCQISAERMGAAHGRATPGRPRRALGTAAAESLPPPKN